MTKREKAYPDRVASLGCVVCRNQGYGDTPAQIHHIRAGQGMSQRASNHLVILSAHRTTQTAAKAWQYMPASRRLEAIYGSELDLLAQTIGDVA